MVKKYDIIEDFYLFSDFYYYNCSFWNQTESKMLPDDALWFSLSESEVLSRE